MAGMTNTMYALGWWGGASGTASPTVPPESTADYWVDDDSNRMIDDDNNYMVDDNT